MAQACIFHFNQNFIASDFIQNHILKDKGRPGGINHECFCENLLFRNHVGNLGGLCYERMPSG